MPSLLLLSTSTVHGTGYLEHALAELEAFLGRCRRVTFVPFALQDRDAYAARARAAFLRIDREVTSLHEAASPREALQEAEAVFVGGGNTFRLLHCLYTLDLMDVLRQRVREGLLYSGASAGANLACPTLKTTNDMPIVEPPTFDALDLVPFQINPHYVDSDPARTDMGEPRATRIAEFHEENATPVVGLREGAMLRVEGDLVTLRGGAGARIFRRGREPVEVSPVADRAPFLGA